MQRSTSRHARSARRVAAMGLAVVLTAATMAHGAADSLLSWNDLQVFRIYHAFAASDGRSYIEEVPVPAQVARSGGAAAYTYFDLKPQAVRIARSTTGSMIDWHYAGESRHLIIPLQGDIVFDLGDGKLFHLKAGEAILAEDWTGKGHRSGCEATNKQTCVVIDILVDPNPHSLPLREPPAKPLSLIHI